mmetsp:Transcript_132292/g.215433  ORF Transcript_132292/g.215433 Transcript_132292/m.215433 type:complete len:183 (+) Transcript_132292:53-601(+)
MLSQMFFLLAKTNKPPATNEAATMGASSSYGEDGLYPKIVGATNDHGKRPAKKRTVKSDFQEAPSAQVDTGFSMAKSSASKTPHSAKQKPEAAILDAMRNQDLAGTLSELHSALLAVLGPPDSTSKSLLSSSVELSFPSSAISAASSVRSSSCDSVQASREQAARQSVQSSSCTQRKSPAKL